MELKLDLHIHSEHSPDGRMTLQEIVAAAKAKGLQGVAICDHDQVLAEAPAFPDFLLIPGVELSTQYGHLLGWFVTKELKTKDFFEAATAIHEQGGLAVLAHPFEHSRTPVHIEELTPFLDGIEVFNSRATRKIKEANALAEDFAAAHGLRRFGGSDAHLPQELGACTTTINTNELTLEAAKEALLAGNAAVQGKASKARYTALSQLTRRRKTGAGAAEYLKWALFAAKCCLLDIIRG